MENEKHDTHEKHDVNESSGDVKREKPEQPKNDQDCGDYSKHFFISIFPSKKTSAISFFRIALMLRRARENCRQTQSSYKECDDLYRYGHFWILMSLSLNFLESKKYNVKVSRCEQISSCFFHTLVTQGKVKDSSADESTRFLGLGGVQMETLLIVLLVVFLLGGGGWGYSRWRRN